MRSGKGDLSRGGGVRERDAERSMRLLFRLMYTYMIHGTYISIDFSPDQAKPAIKIVNTNTARNKPFIDVIDEE